MRHQSEGKWCAQVEASFESGLSLMPQDEPRGERQREENRVQRHSLLFILGMAALGVPFACLTSRSAMRSVQPHLPLTGERGPTAIAPVTRAGDIARNAPHP